jgi:hypothetical protein
MKKRLPPKALKLTVEQIRIVTMFADYAFDYPLLTFDEVARKAMGSRPFPETRIGREFERQAREVVDAVNLAYRASLKRRAQGSRIRSAIIKSRR